MESPSHQSHFQAHLQSSVLPSPSTSDSTLSTDSYLYTPENHSTALPNSSKDSNHAEVVHSSKSNQDSLNLAHTNFFQSAHIQDGFQQGGMGGQEIDCYRPKSSQGVSSYHHQDESTPTLANAVEFYGGQSSNSTKSPASLKRQLGHLRTPSAGRRHSIQSLMPLGNNSPSGTSWSDATMTLNAAMGIMESPSRGLYLPQGQGVDQGMEAGLNQEGEHHHNITDYLVSPPRNMVNLAPSSYPDWTSGAPPAASSSSGSSPDEIKRQRVAMDTPEGDRRERDSTPLAQDYHQVTPPSNAWTALRGLPPNTGSSTTSSHRTYNQTQDTSWTPGSPASRSNDRDCQPEANNRMGLELGLDLDIGTIGIDPRSHELLSGFAPDSSFAPQEASGHSLLDRSMSMSSVSEDSVSDALQLASTMADEQLSNPPPPPQASPPSMQEVELENSNDSGRAKAQPRRKKENEDNKWPEEVEVAFWEGLRLIPKLGRRKVLVNGKPCGRNELIGIYIERKTGHSRNRKQVSSHIQVLKQSRKGDAEFFELIAEPVHEAQFFMPAGGVSYVQTLAGYGYSGLSTTGEGGIVEDADEEATEEVSLENAGASLFNSPHLNKSPLPETAGSMAPPPPRSAGLSSAMEKLHLPTPAGRSGSTSPATCPILPATFAMWAHCSDNDAKHVYTLMDRKVMASYTGGVNAANRLSTGATPSLPVIVLDSVRVSAYRFPGLSAMYRRLPCRFLHVHVPLSVPRLSSNGRHFNQFSTQLSLTSKEKERLVSVTSVYSHGGRVLSLVEPLGEPRRIAGAGGGSRLAEQTGNQDGATTPLESLSPWVGGSPLPDANGTSSKHRYVHQAPFATDFWADLLSRTHPVHIHDPEGNQRPAFSKEPSERAALGMAVSGVTLIQEFIVRDEGNGSNDVSRPLVMSEEDASSKVSPGSSVGNVVLVIAWDLECVEALRGQPGVPTVSVLELPTEQMSGQKRGSVGSNSASPAMGTSPLQTARDASSNRYPIPKMKLITLGKGVGQITRGKPTPPPKLASLPSFTMPSVSSTSSANSSKPVTPRMGDVPTLAHTAPTPEQQLGKARRTSEAHAQAVPSRSASPCGSASSSRSPSPNRSTLASSSSSGSINLQAPSSGSLARKRGVSIEKRLTVSIPPVPSYLNNGGSNHLRGSGCSSDLSASGVSRGQDTSPALVSAASSHNPEAWGQMQQRAMHTPITPFPQVSLPLDAPPPLIAHDEAKAQRDRLARKWAQETGADLRSPLDGTFSGMGMPSMGAHQLAYNSAGMEQASQEGTYQFRGQSFPRGHSFPQHPSSMAMTPGAGGVPMQMQGREDDQALLLPSGNGVQEDIGPSLLSPVGFSTDQPPMPPHQPSHSNSGQYRQRQTSHNGFEMGLDFGAGFGIMQMDGGDVSMSNSDHQDQHYSSQQDPQDPDDFMNQLYSHIGVGAFTDQSKRSDT